MDNLHRENKAHRQRSVGNDAPSQAERNEVEYKALFTGFILVEALGAKEMDVKADIQVVLIQVMGEYVAKGKKLKKYLQQVWEECDHF